MTTAEAASNSLRGCALMQSGSTARLFQWARTLRRSSGASAQPFKPRCRRKLGDPRVAEEYNLETGTWIGAALDQGVWYPITATLSLPLAPGAFVPHKMEFAYTRPVPCVTDSAALSCIEIVLRAAPDPGVMQSVLDRLARAAYLPRTQHPQLWSATEMRLVTDPKSLQPYRREIRRHLYWWSGARKGPMSR